MALSWRTTEASGREEARTQWIEVCGVRGSATTRQCGAQEHQDFCAAKGVGTAEMGKSKRKRDPDLKIDLPSPCKPQNRDAERERRWVNRRR